MFANVLGREEDVCEKLYKDTLKTTNPNDIAADALKTLKNSSSNTSTLGSSKGSKVNQICDGFLALLSSRIDTNLQNLVTAHVCKVPPDLEAGLRLVARLRGIFTPQHE